MTRVLVLAATLALAHPAWAMPTSDQILTELGFSPTEKQRVLKGEFVTAKVGAVSERDLSFAIAFLVKASPQELSSQVMAGALVTADPQVQAYGALGDPGSLAELEPLRITADEADALASTEAGEGMNWSGAEFASMRSHRGRPRVEMEGQLRRMLLERYQAYRASGLGGIASYDRGGGRVADPASDLRKAGESATALQRYMPALQAALLDYPRTTLPGMQQKFFWLKSNIHGKPTYVLTHILLAGEGEARAVVRREFYVSTGYNAEQSVAGFLPVEGGTIVLSMSHAFTDQVTGAAGALKRSIGSRIMADQMKAIFETGRKRIER